MHYMFPLPPSPFSLPKNTFPPPFPRRDPYQSDNVELGAPGWKERYYAAKLKDCSRLDVGTHYLEGLVWVLKYYYKVR